MVQNPTMVQIRMINHHKIVLKNAVKCFFFKMVFLNVIKMVFILYNIF
jgi:hypothetical protein